MDGFVSTVENDTAITNRTLDTDTLGCAGDASAARTAST